METRAKTKIICTMGPSVNTYEKISELIDAGMNVARLNFSHGTHEQHLQTILLLKKARKEKKVPLAIMLDTKGPEIRIGHVPGGAVELAAGQMLFIGRKPSEGRIHMTPEKVFDCLSPGMIVLFDNGYISSEIRETQEEGIVVEIKNAGTLTSKKGVNVPNVEIPLPSMTEEDRQGIIFGCKHEIDLIAASFIRSAENILEIKALLAERGSPDIPVIAKIENMQGVENFKAILQVADGIMVARGDLGVELPLQKVPALQKMMIRECYHHAKPVITATQMLESMIHNPRPTRAEVSDVANAIYDSTSAVMLSGETAVGLYPTETVRMMKNIILEAEKDFDYRAFFDANPRKERSDVSSSVALASVKTAYSAEAKAVFAFTCSGSTARMISKFRPAIPILTLTSDERIYHRLSLIWGVIPIPPYPVTNVEEAFSYASRFSLREGLTVPEDLVVITAGFPFGVAGTTNMMTVDTVKEA